MQRVIVITGAGGGLGSVFAKKFAADGYKVAILDFNLTAAKEVAKQIVSAGGSAIAIQCDVTSKESMEAAREEVRAAYGKLNVLLNCAGIQDPLAKTTHEKYLKGDELNTVVAQPDSSKTPEEAREELLVKPRTIFNVDSTALERVMRVNWLGTVISCQVFAVDLVGNEANSIINITSMAAYNPLSLVLAYASSKAAVDTFTRWLSNYLSDIDGKVRVNAVAPGYFLTPLNHDMYVKPDGNYTPRYYDVIRRTPMGRLGNPVELYGALKFLADPSLSGYITGQVIAVDGGFLSCPGV